MYHFLSSDLTKLNLENWANYKLKEGLKEKEDYVLVNDKVWNSLKLYYGGGPEIPLFLVDDSKKQIEYKIPLTPNFLFHQPYIYGYPDKSPKYLSLDFVCKKDMDSDKSKESLRVSYTLLVSYAMSFKQLVYY